MKQNRRNFSVSPFFILHSRMHPYIAPVAKQFRLHADKERAAGAKAYMRNQFAFFGLPTPLRRSITSAHIKNQLPPYDELEIIVKELYAQPQREFHYFAIELAGAMKKQWELPVIGLFEFLLVNHSWWDTVDHAASYLLGPYFIKFPQQISKITPKWNRSDNFWLVRSSIMFQKMYKQKTDTELLGKYILSQTSSKEFFIQKAIGWALREYGRTNPDWVRTFVRQNKLAPLSSREALKRISV